LGALLALLLGSLAFSTGAFVFGGLLSPMAGRLGVSVNAVAQLRTAFAIGCTVGGLIGGVFGRQASLWYISALSILVAVLIAILVPPNAAIANGPVRQDASSVLRWPLTGLYATTCLAVSAPFASVGLIGPIGDAGLRAERRNRVSRARRR